MADSIALQILKTLNTRLELASVQLGGATFTPPSNLTVQRERIGVVNEHTVTNGALILIDQDGQQEPERKHHASPMEKRWMDVVFTIIVDASALPTSDALDPATNWVFQALQSEPTLGGIAHWIKDRGYTDGTTSFDQAETVLGLRELKVRIEFHHRTGNPESRS